jgi:quinol monooxygenase YgiN
VCKESVKTVQVSFSEVGGFFKARIGDLSRPPNEHFLENIRNIERQSIKKMSNTVSIHPYFKVHEGKLDDFLALLPEFIEITASQDYCHWYDFTVSDEGVVHCREAYEGAEGLIKHVEGVGSVIERALKISDIIRCEIHGPAAELAKLKEPMSGLNPSYFTYQTGIGKPS